MSARASESDGAPGQATCRAWVSGNTDASTHETTAVVLRSGHIHGPIDDLETERLIANEMRLFCETPGQTSTRVNLEAFLQDLLDDKRYMYEQMHYRYYPKRERRLFTLDVGYDEGPIFSPKNDRLLLLYRSGDAPVLGAHLVNFLVKIRRFDDYLYEFQQPIYAEDLSESTTDDSRCRLPIPKLLTGDLVDEIRQRIADVTEIWLQFPADRAPFLIVMNRHNQYDYIFGEQSDSTLETPWSDATGLRFQSNASDETCESNDLCGAGLYRCDSQAFYRGEDDWYPRAPRDSYLDHLYNVFVTHRTDGRSCRLQLASPGSGVIHCAECANASAMDGGLFYYVQHAPLGPLTSIGPCPIARYVLCTLSKWHRGERSGDSSVFDVATPVIHDVRMALHKRRVRHKVLAVDALKKGAEPAPGTTAFATAMGRAYGTRHGKDGHWPFASVDDGLQSPEYKTNKMLYHFAKGFNDTIGRPVPEWGGEGDVAWRRRVCKTITTDSSNT